MRKAIIIAVVSLFVVSFVCVGTLCASGTFDDNTSEPPFDKGNRETWFDESGSNKVSPGALEKIKEGMSFEEIVSLIGKPTRDIGSGAFVMEWNMESGEFLKITFNPVAGSKNAGDLCAYVIHVDSKTEPPVTETPVVSPTPGKETEPPVTETREPDIKTPIVTYTPPEETVTPPDETVPLPYETVTPADETAAPSGTPGNATETPASTVPESKDTPKGGKTVPIICASAAAVLIAAGAVFFALRAKKKKGQ